MEEIISQKVLKTQKKILKDIRAFCDFARKNFVVFNNVSLVEECDATEA
jgi:hypothetical protein